LEKSEAKEKREVKRERERERSSTLTHHKSPYVTLYNYVYTIEKFGTRQNRKKEQ